MRKIINFNNDWYFSKTDVLPHALDDSYEKITIPHTWNAIDGQDGGNDYYRGTCCYLKTFSRNALPDSEEIFLEFLGVNASGDVYLNEKHLAHHDGGYSLWRVNITDVLEEENTLVVAVDNSKNETVYPQMADFTFYGGIYRNVNIIGVNHTHFGLEYYGDPGLKVTPREKDGYTEVKIKSFVTGSYEGMEFINTIYDQAGNLVKQEASSKPKVKIHLENPHLWNGKKDPYLYTAEVVLKKGDEVIDQVRTRFGVRTFEIDPNRGFILNGEEYPLRGVSRHQDRKGIGNALLPEHHEEDMKLIDEMGANTIRLAHYQHDPYFYDLCDEYGMVVWAEIPYISKHMPSGRQNTIDQMSELIVQNYHHPSIVVWGLSNEITLSSEDEDLMDNHRVLKEVINEYDHTRLTTMACVSMCSPDSPLLDIPDVVSYNHYFGWYGGDTSMNGPWFDKFHKNHPDKPIGISEYGCEALNWHTSHPIQGDYSEEYQAYYHEELIKQIKERPYLWATHVWNMFDFGADGRCEGGENGQNHKGLVTFDRKYKKDSFYAYQAWLSDKPMIHLCGKRYIDRVEDTTKITVYSNQPEVEVYLNDEFFEKKKTEHFFYFEIPNIGETRITVKAGELSDEGMIRKVDTFNESYTLKEAGAVLNWFDVTEVEGYYSLNDTIGDISKSEGGKQLLASMMSNFGDAMNVASAGFDVTEDMQQMMNGYTVLRLVNLLAGTMNVNLTKEQLLALNAKLNEIPKE